MWLNYTSKLYLNMAFIITELTLESKHKKPILYRKEEHFRMVITMTSKSYKIKHNG